MSEPWWKKAVVYQIYPRSFMDSNGDGVGDLNGITSKLDYLQELGVDVLWLSPVYQSPGADNGYDISDYQNIQLEFGTMEDFDRMLSEAHGRGLHVVMDLVVNHTSDEHRWFVQARQSKTDPYRDYYIWKKPGKNTPPNNWGSWFYGPAWTTDEKTGEFYLHIFSEKQPDLNWENPRLRREVYNIMKWWLEKGIDGFRMDVISLISKNQAFPDGPVTGTFGEFGDLTPYCENGPRVHEYLQEMNREVLSKYDIMTVGETPHASVEDAVRYANADGSELNMVFQFEHMTIDHGPYGKYTKNRFEPADLVRTMSKWQNGLFGEGWNSLYWENHDQPRSVSRFGDTSTPLLWEKSAKMLATALHMLQGTPYIYQGQEIGMTNPHFASIDDYRDVEAMNAYENMVLNDGVMHPDEFLGCIHNLGRDNARTPMQWDLSSNAGFTTGVPWMKVNPDYTGINVAAEQNDPGSILNYYKQLIAFRKKYDIITTGRYHLLETSSKQLWAYERVTKAEKLLVVLNFSNVEHSCSFVSNEKAILIANYQEHKEGKLQPYEAIVYFECL